MRSTVLLLLLCACSAESTSTPADSSPSSGTSSSGGATPSKPNIPTEPAVPAPVIPEGACPGKTGELYEINVKKLASTEDYPLCQHRGQVLLIVNGASFCGQTYQYEPLQALYAKYKDRGFTVLAFPSRSFNQESSTDTEVSTFCTTKYAITFPLFTIAPVVDVPNFESAQPVYQWLQKQPGMEAPVPWNFEKFLIGRDGKVAKRYNYITNPTMTDATPEAAGGGANLAHAAQGIVNIVEDGILTELEKTAP